MFRRIIIAVAISIALAASAAAVTNPGVYSLASKSITTALSAEVQTPIINLAGATGATIVAVFSWGSGGTSVAVAVATSCDGGTVWYDVAYFAFTTASATKYANLSGLTAKGVTSYAALVADGVNDGLVCDRWRAVITSVGTYANTTLSVRLSVR